MKPSKRAAAAPRNRDRKRVRKPPSAQLCPDWFYRLVDATRYFGYSPTQLDEKIRTGQVPAPISLSDSGGRAKGWFGRQNIAWQAAREAASVARTAAAKPTTRKAEQHKT